MFYAVGLNFNVTTDNLILNIWKQLAETGLADYLQTSGNHPHITLGIFEDLDVEKTKLELEFFTKSLAPFPLSFQQIGIFPSPKVAVFWGPVVTKGLLELHSNLYKQLSKFGNQPDFDFYKPGHWVPHCALAMEIEDTSKVLEIVEVCRSLPNPHDVTIEEIGLISIRPILPIVNYPLLGMS
jgi:2'-5' RNA ligase